MPTIHTSDWGTFPDGMGAAEPLWVMSDAHGQAAAYAALLHRKPRGSRLIFLGDAMDRGPDNLGVLRLLDADPDAILLHGNHDIFAWYALCPKVDFWLRRTAQLLWERNGGWKTRQQLQEERLRCGLDGRGSIPLWERVWKRMRSHHVSGDLLFVHGGLPQRYADEVLRWTPEMALNSDDYTVSRYHYTWYRFDFDPCDQPVRLHGKAHFQIHGHTPCTLNDWRRPYAMCVDFGYTTKAALEIDGKRWRLHRLDIKEPNGRHYG